MAEAAPAIAVNVPVIVVEEDQDQLSPLTKASGSTRVAVSGLPTTGVVADSVVVGGVVSSTGSWVGAGGVGTGVGAGSGSGSWARVMVAFSQGPLHGLSAYWPALYRARIRTL